MSAPCKEGLDYFPFAVDLLTDRKLRRVKLKYGYLAPMVYVSLLSILYKDKGYYIDYSDNKKEDVLWDILNILQGKYQPTAEAVAEIIEELVACELFSGDQFNSKIITSIRAQRTFYRSTVDRKAVDIDFDKWLLNAEEMKALSEKNIILRNYLNRPNNGVNQPNNGVNRLNNPQSKVKESKVEESKVEEREEDIEPAGTSRQPPSFPLDSFEYKASEYLRDNILERIPHARVPKDKEGLQKWAVHIERMKRLDGLTEDEIRGLIKFATTDPFWQTNILSTVKLRGKKDTLYAQMKNAKNNGRKASENGMDFSGLPKGAKGLYEWMKMKEEDD